MKIELTCHGLKTHLAIASIFFVISYIPFAPSFAQFQANLSSNCENGNCTTTICIDDKPCETTTSNSTNITSLDGLLQNKTIPAVPNTPGEII